jgi:hypothetical protein
LAAALDVELFENAVFNDRNPTFFGLRNVDQHFLFHDVAFFCVCGRAASEGAGTPLPIGRSTYIVALSLAFSLTPIGN